MSVCKSLEHAALRCGRKLILDWVDSSDLEASAQIDRPREFHAAWQALCSAGGVLVPGGFGLRGTEGMILAAKWAREKKVPFLGICLGFQMAVVEYARHVIGVPGELISPLLFLPLCRASITVSSAHFYACEDFNEVAISIPFGCAFCSDSRVVHRNSTVIR